MIPPCPTKAFPGVWELPLVMWNDLKVGGVLPRSPVSILDLLSTFLVLFNPTRAPTTLSAVEAAERIL